MKKIVKQNPVSWIGIWIALGAAIGVPLENIPLGVGIGTCIGVFLFLTFTYKRNKKIS